MLTTTDLHIRDAGPDDAEACGRIFYDAFAAIAEPRRRQILGTLASGGGDPEMLLPNLVYAGRPCATLMVIPIAKDVVVG